MTTTGPRVVAVLDGMDAQSGSNPQLLSSGLQLAQSLGGHLAAIVIGAPESPGDPTAEGLREAGVVELQVAKEEWLAEYQAEAYIHALAQMLRHIDPALTLMAHDAVGREIAPRLAARLSMPVVTDCISLQAEVDEARLVATRPCFSGKALSDWEIPLGQPSIATLRRQSAVEVDRLAQKTNAPLACDTVPIDPPGVLRARLHERTLPPAGDIRLEDAEVVIAVGRGIGSREAFEEHFANRLAPLLGAACGGSRGAVDLGIVTPEMQIGLTGRVVSPSLYIAVGLSGSPQHMAGCSGAQTIVAVNTDPQAPIFGFAHYGVVGDYRNVIPALADRLQELLAATRAASSS